ncbi:class II aldolase/adducin family protein [Variovorax sp. UC122_21]|uniref:class II aldolase/adducin family protein n=1 Tax=Variovorax sp. UC122_21 TaxID=3374554 RepID=UPI0037565988
MNSRAQNNSAQVRDQVTDEEWSLRVELAACYRLVALYGWTDLVYTHISVRLPGPEHHFLINPYGLMFNEVTASNLVKVDMNCEKVIPTEHLVNPAGFVIHSAIHEERSDIQCILHTHSRAGVAVSAQKAGILPISQQSTFIIPSLSYHTYEGVAVRDEEKERLQKDLGSNNFFVLRNHGLLTVGRSIPEAFLNMYTFENACRIQLDAQSGGELVYVEPAVIAGAAEARRINSKGMGANIAWPALIRKAQLESPGYDT